MISNKSDAELLYSALHDKHKPPVEPSTSSGVRAAPSKVKSRGLFYKKKGSI